MKLAAHEFLLGLDLLERKRFNEINRGVRKPQTSFVSFSSCSRSCLRIRSSTRQGTPAPVTREAAGTKTPHSRGPSLSCYGSQVRGDRSERKSMDGGELVGNPGIDSDGTPGVDVGEAAAEH
jgi:hypothetical protein